jgi:predicted glycosyltransferase
MKILIDIGHPAHVHYFRNLADYFVKTGSEVLFTTRDKEVAIKLLDHYGFQYVNFGKPFKSRIGKIWGLFWFTWRLFVVALKFKPDIYLNATQYSAVVAWLLRKPHISLEDTFNFEQVRLYLPFTSVVLTGSYPHPELGKKEIHYDGYQELAYLHPKRYEPDLQILKTLEMKQGEKYIVLRFISWNASHDFGSIRMSFEQKKELIDGLEKYAKIFISSEADLPKPLKKYHLHIPPHKIHDVLAFASLYIGEGATMTSECAMLGTPAIYINAQDVHTIREQEKKYGLVFSYKDFNGILDKAMELMKTPDLKGFFRQEKEKMLSEKIDLTAFLVWFVENYPESKKIMKENPEYQKQFR